MNAVDMLKSRSAADRMAAVRHIGRTREKSLADSVIKALEDRSNLVVAEAAKVVRSWGLHEAADTLARRYEWMAEAGVKRDPGSLARREIVAALASLEAHGHDAILFDAIRTVQVERTGNGLDDMAVPLRAQAAYALAQLRPPGALSAIAILLFDIDPPFNTAPEERPFVTLAARRAAARSIAILGDPGGAAVTAVRIKHRGEELPEVLVECMDTLAALEPEMAIHLLTPYLDDRNPYLVAGAATSLASVAEGYRRRVLDILVQACPRGSLERREAIALAIASIRLDEGVDALQALIEKGDETTAEACRRALETLQGRDAHC